MAKRARFDVTKGTLSKYRGVEGGQCSSADYIFLEAATTHDPQLLQLRHKCRLQWAAGHFADLPASQGILQSGLQEPAYPGCAAANQDCHEVTSEGHGIGDALLDGGFCGVGLKATRLSKRIGEDGASKKRGFGESG
jgi:hypothetical protein